MPEQLIIAGERRDAASGETFTVIEPATGAPLAEVAKAGPADVDAALAAATAAFADGRGAWARTSATERGRVLHRVAELLREREDLFATTEARGAGHPIGDARWEVGAAAGTFEYYAGAANKHLGSVVPVQDAGIDVVLREPVGPVGLIVPWNFPLLIACWKLAPALACGNPVILKPASLTPLTALLLGDLLVDAGVPADQVHVLPGPGGVIGDALVSDHRTAKISFTGETTTGASILKASADHIARVSLELGGKSAAIVFADANVAKAAAGAPMSVFGNAGQDCCAQSRILVERAAYDEFLEVFEAATRAIRVGDPLRPETEMGPLISEGQRRVARVRRDRLGGGRPTRLGRRGARRRRLLPDPGRGRRRHQRHAHRPGGDLRPGGVGAALRLGGGGDPDRQRLGLQAVGLALDRVGHPGHPGRPIDPHRHPVGEHEPIGPVRAPFGGYKKSGRRRARDAGDGRLHRGQERLLLRGGLSPTVADVAFDLPTDALGARWR
ncbi:MAG: aldehyde dehydrogenase family protein [Acidimicrobiales bacterium]